MTGRTWWRRGAVAAGLVALAGLMTATAGGSDEQQIDAVIEAVVAAHHTGDVSAMAKVYSAEATMTPGDYTPPLAGWPRVEAGYRQAFANLSGAEMARENTRIVTKGKIAWATYQWRFAGARGEQFFSAEGHTTLILEKRGDRWQILHNHSSTALPARTPPAQGTATGGSGRPGS